MMFTVKLSMSDVEAMKGTYEFLLFNGSCPTEKRHCKRVLNRLNNIIKSK